MKSRIENSKSISLQTILFVLFIGLMLMNCSKEEILEEEGQELTSVAHKWRIKKIKICYSNRNGHCRIIKIKKSAWKWYKKRGAVRLDDQDGDGYVPDNACGYGKMGDCDDNDASKNPGIAGSCGDPIDTDGDGIPDKDDDCPTEAGPAANNGCPTTELTDYEVLKILYEANPGNTLDWDLTDTSMVSWEEVELDDAGNVSILNIRFDVGITTVPPEIGLLNNLKALLLFGSFESIPNEIGDLENLESLILAADKLQSFPLGVLRLPKLEGLGIAFSEFTMIPEEIGQLISLRVLSINSGELNTIPHAVGDLPQLEQLILSGNQLTAIPSELAELVNLSFLDITGNPVTIIPQAVCDLADADTEVQLDADDVCQ